MSVNTGKVMKGIHKKMQLYHGVQSDAVHSEVNYDNYEEAKKAGDVKGMVSKKLSAYHSNNRSVVSLSREYADLSITEIQENVKHYADLLSSAKKVKDHLYEVEEKRRRAELKKTVGGITPTKLEETVDAYMRAYDGEEYLEAVSKFEDIRKQYNAYRNAKDIYIEEHRDLIEAEKRKAEQAELLASGILEEFGISAVSEV